MVSATDRSLRTLQERTLFDIVMTLKMLDAQENKEARRYLRTWEKRTYSGMTAEEIDAVRERVNQVYNAE